jgi:hypothetical protein
VRAGAIATLILFNPYLVVQLGVTSSPWSKEAVGTGLRAPPETNVAGRTGLSPPPAPA